MQPSSAARCYRSPSRHLGQPGCGWLVRWWRFTTLDLLWLSPTVFENLAWNAYFPVPFFVAAVVLAWVVALGRVRWWPVLVFVASVAAQSHLTFVIPSVVLTLTALIFGLQTVRLQRLGWLITGVGVGLVCWLAPLVQEAGGNGPGNLSALAGPNGGEAIVGFGFGLRLLGAAGSLHPLWLTHLPTAFFPLLGLEYAHAPWFGGLIIGLLLCITVVALAAGRRRLGALGAIALAAAVGEMASFAVFPADNLLNLSYLINSLWVVSILIWSVVVWAAVSIGLWVWHRYGGDERPPIVPAASHGWGTSRRWAWSCPWLCWQSWPSSDFSALNRLRPIPATRTSCRKWPPGTPALRSRSNTW